MPTRSTLLRTAVSILAATALNACVTVPPPEPSISRLTPDVSYYIQSIEVRTSPSVTSETISKSVKAAMENVPATAKPTGTPVKLQITVTKLHDVTPGEALWVGGINSIKGAFTLMRPRDERILYSIVLDANSANYAPGGIIGLIAEASSDDEPKLANALVQRFQGTVMAEKRLIVQEGATRYVSKTVAGNDNTESTGAKPTETAVALKTRTVAAKPKAAPIRRVPRKGFYRLKDEQIKLIFQDTSLETYPDRWNIEFTADGKWEGTKHGSRMIHGYGTWRVRNGMHCLTIDDHDAYAYENVEPGSCQEVWVNEEKALIRMVDPRDRRHPVIVKEDAFAETDLLMDTRAQALRGSNTTRAAMAARTSGRHPFKKGFNRLKTDEIRVLFSDNFFNYPGKWNISFSANGKWEGDKAGWNPIAGHGTWSANNDRHCLVITDTDARDYEPIETGKCYEVWVDEATETIAFAAPGTSGKRIIIKEKATGDIARLASMSN